MTGARGGAPRDRRHRRPNLLLTDRSCNVPEGFSYTLVSQSSASRRIVSSWHVHPSSRPAADRRPDVRAVHALARPALRDHLRGALRPEVAAPARRRAAGCAGAGAAGGRDVLRVALLVAVQPGPA